MRHHGLWFAVAVVVIALGVAWPAAANVLTFNGGVQAGGDGVLNGNGELIDQTNGDIVGMLDVQYDSDVDAVGDSLFSYQDAVGYGGLSGVAYYSGANDGEIGLIPLGGYTVTLHSFVIGSDFYAGPHQIDVNVLDAGTLNTLFTGTTAPIWSPTSAHVFLGIDVSSDVGLLIRFNKASSYAGIDNIDYTLSIPEPASLVLLGVGTLALCRRRTA